MYRSKFIALVIAALMLTATAVFAGSMPLNTGYDYSNYNAYPVALGIQDNYWINIASYPLTTSAVAPAFVVPATNWALAYANSTWINNRNVSTSVTGVDPSNPGYTLYRKCFCLNSGYSNPVISFTARADDNLQIWLNSLVNTLLPPQFGQFNAGGVSFSTSNPGLFHAGKNCIYALVEDTYGGQTGFNLVGTVSANGLAPLPAVGVDQTFSCGCNVNPTVNPEENAIPDEAVVAALIQYAEERRLSHIYGPRRR
jgi:hypothetical protein